MMYSEVVVGLMSQAVSTVMTVPVFDQAAFSLPVNQVDVLRAANVPLYPAARGPCRTEERATMQEDGQDARLGGAGETDPLDGLKRMQ